MGKMMPWHRNKAPREAIKDEEVVAEAARKEKTVSHHDTMMMVTHGMAAAVHRGSR
jgi:hypothetical protein